MTASVEDKRFLGRVNQVVTPNVGGDRSPFGFVKPILESAPDLTTWQLRLDENPIDRFPDRGRVFWYDIPPRYDEGDYVSFGVSKARKYDGQNNTAKFQVAEHRTPTEIIDLRSYDEYDLRGIIGTFGVKRSKEPTADTVLIWVEDDVWVGPVSLEENDKGRWVLQSSDPTRLDSWKLPEDGYTTLQLPDGERTFLAPNQDRGEHAGFKNWAPPKEFARGVLKRIRKLNQEAYDALDVTYSAFETYFEIFSEAGLTERERKHELARKERLEDLIETIQENRGLLEEAADALIASDEVQEEIQERKEEIYQEVRNEAERKVQNELKDKRDRLEAAKKEIESKKEDLHTLEDKIEQAEETIEERERELEEQVENYEDRLSERLTELLENTEEAFAELAVITQAIRNFSSQPSDRRVQYFDGLEEKDEVKASETECIDIDDAIEHIGRSFRRRESPQYAALDLHASFASGGIPIVDGEGASDVLRAYAEAVTGGRIHWASIGGSVYEPTDLLGQYDPESARIVPSRYGLLEKIREAKQTEKLYLFVLEGFNRAPVESYLLPLLHTRNTSGGPRNDRSIALAPNRLSSEDPFQDLKTLELPENLLIAATPSRGTSTLPLSSEVWKYATLLPLASYQDIELEENTYSLSEINLSSWQRLVKQTSEKGTSSKLKKLRGDIRERHPRFLLNRIQNRLYRAARYYVDEPSTALELVVRTNIAPRLQNPEIISDYVSGSYIRPDWLERISEIGRELTDRSTSLD